MPSTAEILALLPENHSSQISSLDLRTAITAITDMLPDLDGSENGTVTADKAVVVDENGKVDVWDPTTLKIGGTAITATAAELNALDGVTATFTELNALAGVTAGTLTNSKAAVVDSNGKINTWDPTALKINGTTISATAAELNVLAGVTAGTITNSKGVVVDSNGKVNTWDPTVLKKNGVTITATADNLNKLASFGSAEIGRGVGASYTATAGGDGATGSEMVATVPAGSILLGVVCEVDETFDGDTTTSIKVGTATDQDNLIAEQTTPTADDVESYSGTVPEYQTDDLQVWATWVNTADANSGVFTVRVYWIPA